MRTKVVRVFPEIALERILEALERELVGASDAEILEAAADLGMKPRMQGSAAFLGLRYPAVHKPEDFFEPRWMLRLLNDPRRLSLASAVLSKRAESPRAAPLRDASRTRPGGRKSRRPPKEPREG